MPKRMDSIVLGLLKSEHEIWDLMRCLNLADRAFFANRELSHQKQQCPKTAVQNGIVRDHQSLVILATARWLERTYTIP